MHNFESNTEMNTGVCRNQFGDERLNAIDSSIETLTGKNEIGEIENPNWKLESNGFQEKKGGYKPFWKKVFFFYFILFYFMILTFDEQQVFNNVRYNKNLSYV